MSAHPKDADLGELVANVKQAVDAFVIAVANKQAYRVGDQPTLQYTEAHAESLQYHVSQLERIGT